jgi:hypothetical protein
VNDESRQPKAAGFAMAPSFITSVTGWSRVRLRGLLSQCLCSQDHKDLQILQRRNGEVAPSGRTQKRLLAVASADDEVQVTEQSV